MDRNNNAIGSLDSVHPIVPSILTKQGVKAKEKSQLSQFWGLNQGLRMNIFS